MHPLDAAAFPTRLIAGACAAAFVWFVAAEIGYRLVRPYVAARASATALGAAVGYAAVGSIIALLGVAHALKPWVAIGVVTAAALVRAPAYIAMAGRRQALAASLRDWFGALALRDRAALAVCGFAMLTAAIAAALPAVWWDPIAYHLPIASRALATGTFGIDLGMVQSAFPSLGEAAALPAYALAGSAGAAMSTLFAGLVLAFVCAVLAERTAPGGGPLAAALVTSSALWLWLAPSFYVDIPYALFVVAAIATPLLGPTQGLAAGIFCGALAGAAAGVKYPGLAAGLVALGMLLSVGPPQRALAFGGFAAGAILIAAGWYLRNLIVVGDPVYPFLADALRFPDAVVAFAGRYSDMTRHWCGGGSSLLDLATLPWRLLVNPRSFCGDPGYALRLGVIFALACVATTRRSWPIAMAALALTLIWFESSQQWRFLAPALALFAVLAAVGVIGLREQLRVLSAFLLLALGTIGALVNWLPATISEASSSIAPGYAYVAHVEDGAAYLRRRLETFSAAEWLSSQHVEAARVISLDDVRTYYFGGGLAWANPYYQQRFDLDWTARPSVRYRQLYARGYAYMLVNASPAYVHRTPTGVDWNVLDADVRSGALEQVFRDGDVTVFRIVQQP